MATHDEEIKQALREGEGVDEILKRFPVTREQVLLLQEGKEAKEGQVVYACSCGFQHPDAAEFRKHFTKVKAEQGMHDSLGMINTATGEVVMPPWKDRTPEQKAASTKKKEKEGQDASRSVAKVTAVPAEASHLQVIPKVFQIDYTPIMRIAQEAAVREWGWRPDMPLDNFLDTIIYHAFKDRGITLAGYIVEKEEVPANVR